MHPWKLQKTFKEFKSSGSSNHRQPFSELIKMRQIIAQGLGRLMVQDNAQANNYKFNNYCRTAPTGPKRLRNLYSKREQK